jgi:hypothetical protein
MKTGNKIQGGLIKTASTINEAVELGKVGFEPFLAIQGVQLLRKEAD